MYELLLYNLKVGACLAVFYLFFKLLLSRETLHRMNRLLILGAISLAFALPLCVVTVYEQVPALPVLPSPVDAVVVPTATDAASFPWDVFAGWVYLLGVVATLGLTCFSLWSVLRLIRRGRHERLDDGIVLVYSDRTGTPFSWGRYIVLSERDAAENGDAILLHERSHVELRHSWDLLLTDIAGCLQWFNPAVWLLRRELRAIHEYEADDAVLKSGIDARGYQLLLMRKIAGKRWYSVANSFNRHTLENRITMMLRQKSSQWAGAKALLLLPLAGFALGAFAETVYVSPEDSMKLPIVISGSSRADASAGAAPLYIADGRVFEPSDSLLPRIESLRVLGDSATLAQYAAQYGDRAKNGVVLVELREPGAPFSQVEESAAQLGDVVVVAFGGSETAANAMVPGDAVQPLPTDEKVPFAADANRTIRIQGKDPASGSEKVVWIVDGDIKVSGADIQSADIATLEVYKGSEDILARFDLPADTEGVILVTTKSAGSRKNTSELEEGTAQVKYDDTDAASAHGAKTSESLDEELARLRNLFKGSSAGGAADAAGSEGKVQEQGVRADDPLYLIDGRISSVGEVAALDENRVDRIDVWKGAAAVEKYGAKGATGVIAIRTKDGIPSGATL